MTENDRNGNDVQARDTAMALALVCTLAAIYQKQTAWAAAAAVILAAAMISPGMFRFPARIWFGASQILGSITSRIVLAMIFFTVVTPMALILKACGRDAMGRRKWRHDTASTFVRRDKRFSAGDLEVPY